jgi:hypothetical protein
VDLLGVGTSISHKVRHLPEKTTIDCRAIQVNDANNAAHLGLGIFTVTLSE